MQFALIAVSISRGKVKGPPRKGRPMKFIVTDMSCGHCTATIEKAIAEAGGRASTDLGDHSVTVEGLNAAQAAEVIREAGYTPEPA